MPNPNEVAHVCSPGLPKINDYTRAFRKGRQAPSSCRGVGVLQESLGAAAGHAAALWAPPAVPEAGAY